MATSPSMSPTLFIDRDAWSGKLGAALRAAGIPFAGHRDLFPNDEADPVWFGKLPDAAGSSSARQGDPGTVRPNLPRYAKAARICSPSPPAT